MSQQFDIEFKIAAGGAAEKALQELEARAKKAAKAEDDLRQATDKRAAAQEKVNKREAEYAKQKAKAEYQRNPTVDNLNKYVVASDRVKKIEEQAAARRERMAAADDKRQEAAARREFKRLEAAEKKDWERDQKKQKAAQRDLERQAKQDKRDQEQAAREKARAADQKASATRAFVGGALSQAGLGQGVTTYGNMTAIAESAKLAGYGGAGAMIGRAALPVAVMAQLAQTVKAGAEAFHDEYMTNQQAGRSLFKSIPGGTAILDYADTLSGRKRGMERVEERQGLRMELTENKIAERAYRTDIANRSNQFEASEYGASQMRGVFRSNTNRDDFSSRQAYELESKLLPLRKQSALAERDLATAKNSTLRAQGVLNRLQGDGLDLVKEREALEKKNGNDLNGPEGMDIRNRITSLTKQIDANRDLQMKQQEIIAEKRVAQVDAETNVQMAKLNEERGGIDFLRNREASVRQRDINIALAGPAGRIQADTAIGIVEAMGVENAPPELVQQAQLLYPEKINDMAAKAGRALSAERRGVSSEYSEDITDIRKKINEGEVSVENKEVAIMKKSAEEMTQAFGVIIDVLKKFGERAIDIEKENDNKLRAMRIAKGG